MERRRKKSARNRLQGRVVGIIKGVMTARVSKPMRVIKATDVMVGLD
jgi:molybdopterin-binding protein